MSEFLAGLVISSSIVTAIAALGIAIYAAFWGDTK